MRILFVFVFLSSVAFGQSKLGKWSVEDKNKVRDEIKEFIPDKKTQDCIISSMEKEYESFYDAVGYIIDELRNTLLGFYYA